MTDKSSSDQRVARKYLIEMLPGLIGFVVIFLAVTTWGDLKGEGPGRLVLALLPVLPLIWIVVVVVRHVRRIDEYQKVLLLRSFAVGFGAAMVTAIVIALVGLTGLVVVGAEWYVFIAGMLAWGAAAVFVSKR